MKKVALIYDFDYTLISGNMQEENLLGMLGVAKEDFWQYANSLMRENDMDSVLAAMYAFVLVAKDKSKKFTKQMMVEAGKKISTFYPGVRSWFDRINTYARSIGLEVEHYIISSGFQEMIENCAISDKIHKIFACNYVYHDDDAVWPSYVVNYTQKMQYIARIKKNLLDVLYDTKEINKKYAVDDQYIPYKNMIYIGDGETDVPSMVMVKENGGKSVCVYENELINAVNTAKMLVEDGRVNCAVVADYSKNSKLEAKVKEYLREFADVV